MAVFILEILPFRFHNKVSFTLSCLVSHLVSCRHVVITSHDHRLDELVVNSAFVTYVHCGCRLSLQIPSLFGFVSSSVTRACPSLSTGKAHRYRNTRPCRILQRLAFDKECQHAFCNSRYDGPLHSKRGETHEAFQKGEDGNPLSFMSNLAFVESPDR